MMMIMMVMSQNIIFMINVDWKKYCFCCRLPALSIEDESNATQKKLPVFFFKKIKHDRKQTNWEFKRKIILWGISFTIDFLVIISAWHVKWKESCPNQHPFLFFLSPYLSNQCSDHKIVLFHQCPLPIPLSTRLCCYV